MKKFKLMLVALFVFAGMATLAHAASQSSPYQVTVATVIPNSSVNGPWVSTNVTVGGSLRVREIYISNDGAAERITLWKNCGSTNTATAIWDGVVSASGAATGGNLNVDFLPDNVNVSSVCFHKGTNGSGTIKASLYFQ